LLIFDYCFREFPELSRFFRGEIPSFSVFFQPEYFTRQL
jgi:hypothetical protein